MKRGSLGCDFIRAMYRIATSGRLLKGSSMTSRSGIAGYYRYGPRDVDRLCNDKDHGVVIRCPEVHDSVLERIRGWEVAYAPISFPRKPYVQLQRSRDEGLIEVRPPDEDPNQDQDYNRRMLYGRADDMENVKDSIFRRCVAYRFTVFFTILLAALPLIDWVKNRNFWARITRTSIPSLYELLGAPFSLLAGVDAKLNELAGWATTKQAFSSVLAWMFSVPGMDIFWVDQGHARAQRHTDMDR